MQDTMRSLCCIALAAGLCRQLLSESRSFPAVRMALGLQATLLLMQRLMDVWEKLRGISAKYGF